MTRDEISKNLAQNKPVQIIFYENSDEVNSAILFAVEEVCRKHCKTEFSTVIYGCAKELIINATKANLKRAFFLKSKLDINNMGHYVSGLSKFRAILENRHYIEYYDALRSYDLWGMFTIEDSRDGVKFEVINNSEIVDVENTRIRMKLRKAMNYNDLVDFYDREKDDAEGAGMGIALIVILMRKRGAGCKPV